jgi:pimeloyl-ACP methyl ester carboxylesterase
MSDKTRVLILGGGFGGLYAALEFEKRNDPRFEVTVVNRENFFLFTPMLHEIAASIQEPAPKPAWRSKPCWFLIAEEDRMINPKTQQFMARRMGARVRSSRVDHSPMLTAPDLVIDVIVEAARESLSLAPLEIWGEPRWTATDPQLKEIRK